jgi:hypothetical protein
MGRDRVSKTWSKIRASTNMSHETINGSLRGKTSPSLFRKAFRPDDQCQGKDALLIAISSTRGGIVSSARVTGSAVISTFLDSGNAEVLARGHDSRSAHCCHSHSEQHIVKSRFARSREIAQDRLARRAPTELSTIRKMNADLRNCWLPDLFGGADKTPLVSSTTCKIQIHA